MELSEAISLINHTRVSNNQQTTWADLGCGSGLFSIALAHLLKPGSSIFAIDKDISALKKLRPPNNVRVEKVQADFISDKLNIGNLHGVLMANSLHYVEDKIGFVHKIEKCFTSTGNFVIVEYDMDKSNPWVLYPVSFASLKLLFEKLAYASIEKINELPSKYNRAKIYSSFRTK